MALRLRPFISIPGDLRTWTKWIRESALTGTVATENLDDNSVTLAKIAQVSTDTVLGRATAGTGNVETITCTAAGRALLDDANATAQRATLGLPLGTSGAVVPLLNGANTHASATCTLFAVGSATPVTTQAADPDTSGASLATLEAEVNAMKSVLRTFGLIAP